MNILVKGKYHEWVLEDVDNTDVTVYITSSNKMGFCIIADRNENNSSSIELNTSELREMARMFRLAYETAVERAFSND